MLLYAVIGMSLLQMCMRLNASSSDTPKACLPLKCYSRPCCSQAPAGLGFKTSITQNCGGGRALLLYYCLRSCLRSHLVDCLVPACLLCSNVLFSCHPLHVLPDMGYQVSQGGRFSSPPWCCQPSLTDAEQFTIARTAPESSSPEASRCSPMHT